jgi:hypothetical protein
MLQLRRSELRLILRERQNPERPRPPKFSPKSKQTEILLRRGVGPA